MLAILLLVEDTFASPSPDVYDIKALFELRDEYQALRRPSIESLIKRQNIVAEKYFLEKARKLRARAF
ncbi:MAG: hypothetical protein ACREBS_01505 [Nitrososphaerales archaeon]